MSLVSVAKIAMSYDATPVLERVSIDVDAGSFCTIVGASGCGKSTFLRLLLGQEIPTRGTIKVDGVEIPKEPQADRGVVFQRYSVFPHLTVRDNLLLANDFEGSAVFGRLFGSRRKIAIDRTEAILESIGLSAARDRYPAQLSGGMQQRLAIGQALLKQPRILLLDEPFGALDPGVRADMHELVTTIWREHEMTIFMVTHDISEAFKLGTRLIVFDKVRHDPQFPDAYGATITYDLPIGSGEAARQEAAELIQDLKTNEDSTLC